MSKSKKSRDAYPKVPVQAAAKSVKAPAAQQTHAVRETVESIVIAFVLAFLFSTFEAEAFVIPTGSMAPTLMGRHKDVDCPKCGYRYQVSASEEQSDDPRVVPVDVVAGMCPMCHYVLPMRSNLPTNVPESLRAGDIEHQSSYNGDRILVNKYIYTFSEPERWDIVVFKFPGDAKVNYIKRLVGLPGETLRIYHGDLFVGGPKAKDDDFAILQKPADKVLALRQLVHDTDHDPAELHEAGWPLRWHANFVDDGNGWRRENTIDGVNVEQRYSVSASGDDESWLRYQHHVPSYDVWQRLAHLQANETPSRPAKFSSEEIESSLQLVTDANPYNARLGRTAAEFKSSLQIEPVKQGLHWVGDLIVEADVEVESDDGQLLFDLTEGGQHFRATIDLKSGEAKLSAEGVADYEPAAKTSVNGPGEYRVAFANVDDQLLMWVDGELVAFEGGTAYDASDVFGSRSRIRPRTSEEDAGDLAPARIGARGAKLAVTRLRLWRDIYYIADSANNNMSRTSNVISDFGGGAEHFLPRLASDPSLWEHYLERRPVKFPLGKDQFFVMGDNSAESSDARLWTGDSSRGGRPGGEYLERRLLIGKALCVYWPHSWNRVPGTPIPFPLFPNFGDMRLVR